MTRIIGAGGGGGGGCFLGHTLVAVANGTKGRGKLMAWGILLCLYYSCKLS